MELYTKEGWLNFEYIKKNRQPFNIILGGRGIGKTYGALEDCYLYPGKTLMLRTTQVQADFISSADTTPIKSVLDDHEQLYICKKVNKYMGAVWYALQDPAGELVRGDVILRTAALSTFHNLRGFDGSVFDTLLYDEFNEEDGKTSRKGIANTFFNIYETINRNRELKGREPLTADLFGHAIDIFTDILIEFKLISKICDMQRTGQEVCIMQDRGIALYVLQKSPISRKKENTALYRATGAGSFSDMALKNTFKDVDYIGVKRLPLNQIKAVASCGEICLYKVKSTNKDYVSLHKQGSPKEYTQAEFITVFDRIPFEIAFQKNITFDSPEAKVLIKRLFT